MVTPDGLFAVPKCHVEIHSRIGVLTFTGVANKEDIPYKTNTGVDNYYNNNIRYNNQDEFADSLVSCRTSKSLGDPFGTFTLELVNRIFPDGVALIDTLDMKHLVIIRFSGGSSAEHQLDPQVVMVGFIESISINSTFGMSPQQRIIIEGADFGKTLYDAKLIFAYWDSKKAFVFRGRDIAGALTLVKREAMINTLMEELFYPRHNATWLYDGKSMTVSDFLTYTFGSSKGYVSSFLSNFIVPEGSFWDSFKGISNAPFYELFVDVIPKRQLRNYAGYIKDYDFQLSEGIHAQTVTVDYSEELTRKDDASVVSFFSANGDPDSECQIRLMFRRVPFIDAEVGTFFYKNLPSTHIYPQDIISQSLTRSSHEVGNYFGVDYLSEDIDLLGSTYYADSSEEKPTLWSVACPETMGVYGPRKVNATLNIMPEALREPYVSSGKAPPLVPVAVKYANEVSSLAKTAQATLKISNPDGKFGLGSIKVLRKSDLKVKANSDIFNQIEGLLIPIWAAPAQQAEVQSLLQAIKQAINTTELVPQRDFVEYAKEHSRLLFDWNVYQDEYLSGSFTIEGNPDPKIGTLLILGDSKTNKPEPSFYIQAVVHDFVCFEYYKTSIDVVRGIDANEVFPGKDFLKHSREGLDYRRKSLTDFVGALGINANKSKGKLVGQVEIVIKSEKPAEQKAPTYTPFTNEGKISGVGSSFGSVNSNYTAAVPIDPSLTNRAWGNLNLTFNYSDPGTNAIYPLGGTPYNKFGTAANSTVFGTPAASFMQYYNDRDYNSAVELAINSNQFGGNLLDINPLNISMRNKDTVAALLGQASFYQRSLFNKLWDLDPELGMYVDYQRFTEKRFGN